GESGDRDVLSRDQQRRHVERDTTMGVAYGVVQLCGNRWARLVTGRNIGLMAMELLPAARDALAQGSLGWVAR
ncbi:2-octaprenyl-6-methoxyphenyl hydroxylase, partial [Leptospira borgpetersenii serovar Hardjo-bovis]|nr:2-octaprenyl-6-methoxyphenyl hydroxylase [Leptospira borgpetersenii serovar Hardjo-bovis]